MGRTTYFEDAAASEPAATMPLGDRGLEGNRWRVHREERGQETSNAPWVGTMQIVRSKRTAKRVVGGKA
jgi:hypothetical protein